MNNTRLNSAVNENHKHHIRGDIVSGTGFAYECLWRCRLMLKLGFLDTLTIFKGEDALIENKQGQKVYYQIKYSQYPWGYSKLRKFLDRAEDRLKANPHQSYVFCTNNHLNPKARERFKEIKQKWGDRFSIKRWEPTPNGPLSRINHDIQQVLERHFQPRNIKEVLNIAHIDNCCSKLVALESQLKLNKKNSIQGKEVWEKTGLKQLAEEIPSRIVGERLLPWSSWVKETKIQDADPFLTATRSVVVGHRYIQMDINDEFFNDVSQWSNNPNESCLLLIQGVSGTGKTWLLVQLGMYLSKDFDFPVYCADRRSTGKYPRLRYLPSWLNTHTTVLIDDLFEEEWYHSVIEALSARPPILIISTTSVPPYHDKIRLLKQRCGEKFICRELPPLPTDGDVNKLINYIRKGIVSRTEKDALRSTNIREAARILEGRKSKDDFVMEIYNLWHQDKHQDWVTPLLLCSSLGIKIPRSVLRAYARSKPRSARELPYNLWPVILHSRRENDEILWLEDSDVPQKVFDVIIDRDVDKETLEFSHYEVAVKLMGEIRIESALHRQFARRIVRKYCETYSQYQKQFLEQCEYKISQLLDREPNWALAYIWLPLLARTERVKVARKAARNFLSEPPNSTADVVLLIEAFGDECARKIIHQELPNIRPWNTELWATFIEHLVPLDSHSQRELLRLSIPFLEYGPIDVVGLLEIRNVDNHLASLIGKCGLPEHREWFFNVLNDVLPEFPSEEEAEKYHDLISHSLNLARRCVMQPRNGLAIEVSHKLISESSQSKETLQHIYGEIYDRYKNIYEEEIKKDYCIKTLKRAINYAKALSNANALTKANVVWPVILNFGSEWANSEENKQIIYQVSGFLRDVIKRELPLRLVESTAIGFAYHLRGTSRVSKVSIKLLLKLLAKSSEKQILFRLFLLLIAIIAGAQTPLKKSLVRQARQTLLIFTCNGGDKAKNLAESFLNTLWENTGVSNSEEFVLPSVPEPHELKDPIIKTLLNCIGSITWDDLEKQRLGDAIYKHWGENDIVRRNLLITLLNFNSVEEAKEIMELLTLTTSDDPDNFLLACTWAIKFGDPQQAKIHLKKALRLYRKKGKGGHPPNTSRAYEDLAYYLESPRSEILKLCAALTCLGPLKSLEGALQLV